MHPLSIVLSAPSLTYGLLVPLLVVQLFALLLLPGMLRPGAKPTEVTRAAYCYLAQALGVLLMSVGGLPTLYALLASQPMVGGMYTGLLMIFAAGGILFLAYDAQSRTVDAASRMVPETIFFFTWKFIGLLSAMFAAATFVIRIMISGGEPDPRWWVVHMLFLIYGLVLSWFTHLPVGTPLLPFSSAPLLPKTAHAAAGKPSAKKKKKS
jgi:hypothetical protein